MNKKKINAFGTEITISFDLETKTIIKDAEAIRTQIKEEQIISYCGLETVFFNGLNRIHSDAIMHWIFSNRPNADDFKNDIRGYLLSVSTEDTKWTVQRNKGCTDIFYRKIVFNSDIINAVCAECDRIIEQAQKIANEYEDEYESIRKEKEKEKTEILSPISQWTTEEKIVHDKGGKTVEYIHRIIVDGTEMTFTERNIFDFGRVINFKNSLVYKENGVYIINTPNGKEPLNSAESKAAKAIFKYGKYAHTSVRM